MTDDLRARIAAVLRLHQWRATVRMADDDPVLDCSCGIAFGGARDCQRDAFDSYREHLADAVIRELLPTREGRWGWLDGTVSTNPATGNPIKLEIEPGEVIPLSVDDARDVALALLAAVAECGCGLR